MYFFNSKEISNKFRQVQAIRGMIAFKKKYNIQKCTFSLTYLITDKQRNTEIRLNNGEY